MKLQQWGTFSVKDHLKSRAFVAEVLLFDKLVIPRPATDNEMNAEGGAASSENQVARWHQNQWYPERQRELLDILGEEELAIELPWGRQAEVDWHAIYHKSDSEELDVDREALTQSVQDQVDLAKTVLPEEAAYIASGGVLALYIAGKMQNDVARKILNRARTPGAPVEPVIAYGSYGEFTKDQGVEAAGEAYPVPKASAPYAMFEWEVFVPEDSDKSDAQLLREAAKLASRSEFRETRQYFYGWLKQMYEDEVDRQDAREQMLKKLAEYTAIMRGSGLRTAVRYAAKAATVLAPLVGLAGHTVGVEAGVAVSAAAALSEGWLVSKPEIPERLRPAAFAYDARRFFGKR